MIIKDICDIVIGHETRCDSRLIERLDQSMRKRTKSAISSREWEKCGKDEAIDRFMQSYSWLLLVFSCREKLAFEVTFSRCWRKRNGYTVTEKGECNGSFREELTEEEPKKSVKISWNSNGLSAWSKREKLEREFSLTNRFFYWT